MNLLLYIQITERPENVKFINPLISELKEKNANSIFYDLDNHSDSLIINLANKLLLEADKKIIVIDTELDSNFSKLLSLLTNLADNPAGIEILVIGKNTKLEKMISILPNFSIQKLPIKLS